MLNKASSDPNQGKKKKGKVPILFLLICLAVGVLAGYFSAKYIDFDIKFPFLLLPVFTLIAVYLQLIIHEGGHLVAGLLSGYHFSSFRLGSFVFQKEKGKWTLARLYLPGTAGQCLMDPPEMKEGKVPVILYNLGGVLANLIFSGICLLAAAFLIRFSYLSLFLILLAGIGFVLALVNGYPINTSLLSNDGYNTWMLSRSPQAARSFYTQLKVNHLLSQGTRLRDMPEGLVYLPSTEDCKNPMISAVAVLFENKLIDEKNYEKAQELAGSLLADANLNGIYEQLLTCDIVCQALIDKDETTYNRLYTRELKQFCKQMKDFPATLRTRYIAALLLEKDWEKAEKIQQRFESRMKKYPNQAELYSEIEWMERARQTAEENGLQETQ